MPDDVGWEREVTENTRRYQELHERVSQLSITETSPDGVVAVTVSASGVLTNLALRDTWSPVPLGELAEEIMNRLRLAQARIPDLLQQQVFSVVGTQDPSAHLIVADARNRFPETASDDHGEQPERTDPQADWESRPVMEDL